MKATYANPINCSTDWEKVSGARSGETVTVQYDLGGVCGKVEATFKIKDSAAMGTWRNEYGAGGSLRLVKQ